MTNEPDDHDERRYQQRRERFALAIYKTLAAHAEPSRLTDWKELAKQAVEAADALEEVLNPNAPDLPEYVA